MKLLGKTSAAIGKALGFKSQNCGKGHSPRIVLQTEGTLAVQPCSTAPQEVSCSRGVLWITQEGNGEDIILKQGQRVTLRSRGRVLIQALKDSSFSMTNLPGLKTV